MQMFGQDDDRLGAERMIPARCAECVAQCMEVLNQQPVAGAFGKVDGEKECSARKPRANVATHEIPLLGFAAQPTLVSPADTRQLICPLSLGLSAQPTNACRRMPCISAAARRC